MQISTVRNSIRKKAMSGDSKSSRTSSRARDMFRPRIIPTLLLSGRGIVKTVQFRHPRYLGDPIHTGRIFSSKGADELLLLDIRATLENTRPPASLVSQISDESFMPLAVGGGVRE